MVWISWASIRTTPHTLWGLGNSKESCPGRRKALLVDFWEMLLWYMRNQLSREKSSTVACAILGFAAVHSVGHCVLFWIGVRLDGLDWMLLLFHHFFKISGIFKVGYIRALYKEVNVNINSVLHYKSGQTRACRWLRGLERTSGPIPSFYIWGKGRTEILLQVHLVLL